MSEEPKRRLIEVEKPSWGVSAKWAAAAKWALAMSLSSSLRELEVAETPDEHTILEEARQAVKTLQDILQGQYDDTIAEELSRRQVPRERWWSALMQVIEGLTISSLSK
jgi:hypothetical protein